MISALDAVILGIVEGLTEFLPISSTAHLVLTSELLNITQTEFAKTFEIAIQSGAILAVVVLYWRKFLNLEVIKRIIVAFIPTAVIGLIFYDFIKSHLIGNMAVMLGALAVGGALLIMFEYMFKEKGNETEVATMSYKHCVSIGLFQSIAMIPGVSRAAATIVGGMILGLRRSVIVEFSFLLAVPTMLAATGLDLIQSYDQFNSSHIVVLSIGLIVSFVMAIVSIKFLLNYIKGNTFTAFGVYRVILVAVALLIFTLA